MDFDQQLDLNDTTRWRHILLDEMPVAICRTYIPACYFVLCEGGNIYEVAKTALSDWQVVLRTNVSGESEQDPLAFRAGLVMSSNEIFSQRICTSNNGYVFVSSAPYHVIWGIPTDSGPNSWEPFVLAGDFTDGYKDGPRMKAKLGMPASVVCTSAFNSFSAPGQPTLFFSDWKNNVIRMIANETVSTFAGNTKSGRSDGPLKSSFFSNSASFNRPSELVISADGQYLLVTDSGNQSIRKVELKESGGHVSTVLQLDRPPVGLIEFSDGGLAVSFRNDTKSEFELFKPGFELRQSASLRTEPLEYCPLRPIILENHAALSQSIGCFDFASENFPVAICSTNQVTGQPGQHIVSVYDVYPFGHLSCTFSAASMTRPTPINLHPPKQYDDRGRLITPGKSRPADNQILPLTPSIPKADASSTKDKKKKRGSLDVVEHVTAKDKDKKKSKDRNTGSDRKAKKHRSTTITNMNSESTLVSSPSSEAVSSSSSSFSECIASEVAEPEVAVRVIDLSALLSSSIPSLCSGSASSINSSAVLTEQSSSRHHGADIHVVNRFCGHEFHLHSFVCEALDIPIEEFTIKIEDSCFPKDSLFFFLRTLYNDQATNFNDPDESILPITLDNTRSLCHCRHLYKSLDIETLGIDWALKERFLPQLPGTALCKLFHDIWTTCDMDSALIDLIIAPLRPHATLFVSQAASWTSILTSDPLRFLTLTQQIGAQIAPSEPLISATIDTIPLSARFGHRLSRKIAAMGKLAVWKPNQTDLASTALFRLSIDGYGQALDVPLYVLYAKWPYFRRMMDSGLQESKNHICILPSEFPPALLLCIVKCIFGLKTSFGGRMSKSDCIYALERGGEVGLCEATTLTPLDPFISLWNHCRSMVFSKLSSTNSLLELRLRLDYGSEADVEEAIEFIARNHSQVLVNHPNFKEATSQLPANMFYRIFIRAHEVLKATE